MAATACAYAYQEARPPPLMPAAPSRSSTPQVPEPLFHGLDGGCAAKPASPPVLPPPSLLRPSIFTRQPGLCTEGLGSESSGDVDLDDLIDDIVQEGLPCERQLLPDDSDDAPARKKLSRRAFPPPISVIGAGGKPWLYLRRHRADGRLVLREVRIPSQELLQARREDGRFKLHFAPPQPEDEEEQFEDV
ncbi:hypothetical protein QOZ80_2AG0132900 [Eleusine coracana subsp. coracana]|nr:hypothetical protein QOZ80_2AG0132900 [Eleusine coracana subsp. coracana]